MPLIEKAPSPLRGDELASIIILCCNQVEFTRLCLESVLRHTRGPYELVLVDNGSTDGTAEYLEEIGNPLTTHNSPLTSHHSQLATHYSPERVVVIRNDTNLGFARGCNQGLAEARGNYLVLLNNDVIVTEGWLEGLIKLSLHDWPRTGLVGPVSNNVSPPQQIPVNYRTIPEMEAFAARRKREFHGRALQVQRLIGFCLLFRRDVLDKIGLLDEGFGLGFFEDDDLCVRARQAGYRLAVALGVFIHHFGSRTFAGLGLDAYKMLEDNFAKFQAKWGKEYTKGYRLPESRGQETGVRGQEAGVRGSNEERGMMNDEQQSSSSFIVHHSSLISLCMIVKNEEKHLGECLESVRDLVDEVVVVDTGSTDGTKEVAARAGARVVDFTWVDSFAEARNESLKHASGQWILWLDADERLDESNRQRLRQLRDRLGNENACYLMRQSSRLEGPAEARVHVDQVRLFPRHAGLRWRYRVHEQILPGLRERGTEVRPSDIVIEHVGFAEGTVQGSKVERNLRLLVMEHKERPDDTFILFNLGALYLSEGKGQEGAELLQRFLQIAQPADNLRPKVHALLVKHYQRQGRKPEALAACRQGRQSWPHFGELLFWEAVLLHEQGDLGGAENCLHGLLALPRGVNFTSADSGMQGFRARQFLAEIHRAQGRNGEAEAQARAALAECPGFSPAQRLLAELGKNGFQKGADLYAAGFGNPGYQPADRNKKSTDNGPLTTDISLCMIVKNEEANLPQCLESVAGLFDEIIVVDTGSTDGTREIARRLGAKVFDFPWVDSFAAARNESLKHASGQWIFWLDADDRLDEGNREKLRKLLAGLGEDNAGYVMKCLCLPDRVNGTATMVDHVRLFRNHPGLAWRFRIHEQILPALRGAGADIRWNDVVIHHTGYQEPAQRRRKLERDLRLLRLEDQEHPNHPFTLFNLGSIYNELEQYGEALPLFLKSLELCAPGDSIVRKLYALIVQCRNRLGQLPEAQAACRQGRELFPEDIELLFQEGIIRRQEGDLGGARQCWEDLLALPPAGYFASLNIGIQSYLTRHNLAMVYRDLGQADKEEAQWLACLEDRPNYMPALLGLGGLYQAQGRNADLETLARRLEALPDGRLQFLLLQGRWFLGHKKFDRARDFFRQAGEAFPRAVEPRQFLSHAYLQEGRDWDSAERALKEVLDLNPGHKEARHNLALLCRQRGKPIDPAAGPTLEELYQAVCRNPSDLNEHCPTLYGLAKNCRHVTEMGTRTGVSTTAFLYARPAKLVCYDKVKWPQVETLQMLVQETAFEFHQADVLQVHIEETDLLFIDTWHVYEQLQQELRLHGSRARKFIVLHDTTTFGHYGETPGHGGLWPAVAEFVAQGNFRIKEQYHNNNGLTVLERVSRVSRVSSHETN